MAAGASIGSIYARIGADTSDLQAKLAQSNAQLERFATGANRVGSSASRGLAMAGETAGQVGRRVTAMASVVDHVAGSNVATYAILGHSALEMGKSVLQGAGAVSNLSTVTQGAGSVIKAFGSGPVAGLILATLAAAAGVGTLINKLSGFGDTFKNASGSVTSVADALAKNEDQFRTAADTYDHLRNALKLSGPEWDFTAERTKENALRLSELLDKILQHARVVKETKGVRDGYTQSFLDLGDKIRANKQMLADYTDQVNRTYGVVTAQDITAKLKTTLLDLRIMQKEGIDAQQIITAAGPAILEVIEKAKTMGVTVTPILADMADAIAAKNKLWVGDLMGSLPKIPKEAEEAAGVARKVLDEMGNSLEGSISGGFGRGMEAGTNFGKQQLDAFIATVEQTPITFKIEGDWTSFRDQCKKHGVNFAMDTY